MSNSLGKISAILSLNTAQFQRGCNESARDVRNFAGTIERNIRRASDSAQKSLANILTPIQQLQASMQAAFSQRLSFRGFQGAIRDVEDLKRRLGSLDGRNIALVLNISGERRLDELQQKLREINNRDIRIVTQAGGERGLQAGLERLIQARDELAQDGGFGALQGQIAGVTARIAELNQKAQGITVGAGGSGVAELRATQEEAELLSRSLSELQQQQRRLVSQRLGISIDSSELDQVIAKFQTLGPETVNRLINELGQAQQRQSETRLTRLTSLAEGITKPLEAAVADFARLDMAVQGGFIQALSNAQNEVMGLERTLRETGDYGTDAFNRVERQVDQVIVAIKQMKELSESVSGLRTGNEMVFQQPDLMASLASARKFGDRAAEAMPSLNPADRAEMVARIQLMKELGEQMESVHATMKDAQLRGLTFVAEGSQRDLDEMRQQMAALQAEGERAIPLKVDTAEAKAKIDPIKESLLRIRELADFSFTGNVQSFQQAQTEISRILSAYDRLGEASKAKVGPAIAGLIGDFTSSNGFFDANAIKSVSDLVNAEAAAEKGANDLRDALARVADGINPSKPIDVLKKTLDEAKTAVAKLDPELRAIGERNLARVEKYLRKQPGERSDRASDEAAVARAVGAATTIRDEAIAAAPPPGGPPKKKKDEYADGSASALGSRYFSSAIGRDLDAARSMVKNLGDTPLAGTLGPQLDTLKNKFGILTREAKLTADQVKQVNSISREAGAIRSAVSSRRGMTKDFLSGSGGMGQAGLDLGIDRKALQGAAAEIDLVQKRLSTLSREARGPVIAALENFRRANAKAFKDGSIATDEGKAKLERYRVALVNALAAASGTSAKKLAQELKRVGDVARGSFGNAGLAIQQAAFAIDDFFSVTGGLDQRIRAAGNNLSQLGFILGGTTGLILGISASIGSQLVVALYKWANGGRTTEDQTKALNDALARQKSLVEELKQAFESLGDSIARKAFSAPAQEAREFAKELDAIKKKQKEGREERAFALDERVIQARADVNVAQNRLNNATTRDEAVAAQRQLAEARRRQREEEDRVRNRPAPAPRDVANTVDQIFEDAQKRNARLAASRAANPADVGAAVRAQQIAMAEGENIRKRVAGRLAGASGPTESREILRDEQRQAAARGDTRLVAQLEELINSLEEPIRRATDELAVQILEGSFKVAKSLGAAQALLDETLIPFSQTRAEADKAAGELAKIIDELKTAEDPARIQELEKQRAALEQQSAQYRSAAEVIRTFADTVKRISTDLVNAVEGETRSIADKARRDEIQARAAFDNDFVGDGEFGPNGERRRPGDAQRDLDRAESRRRSTEREARDAEDKAAQIRRDDIAARQEFESSIADDPQVQAERKRLEELQQIIDSKDAAVTQEQKAAAAAERDDILRKAARRFEDSPIGQARREVADRFAIGQEAIRDFDRQRDEKERAALRGRDLGLKPGVREAREAEGGLRDIGAARDEGRLNAQQAQEQATRFARDQMRSAAPAIFEMADQVQNAILQGPSRQALEVSDVSTMEGSRELNRLLRGDDSSKNQNLVELQKQNQKMGELVTVMKDVAQRMGIVLDLT